MALIDARARFAARAKAATEADLLEKYRSRGSGQFGERPERAAPDMELTLPADTPPTLEQVFEEMNELGELDPDLAEAQEQLGAPTRDTYTGTPEQQESEAQRREFHDIVRRAGLDADDIPDATRHEILAGIARKRAQKKSAAEYRARNPREFNSEGAVMPAATTAGEVRVQEAVREILAADNLTAEEMYQDSLDYLLDWARQRQRAGDLDKEARAEVQRRIADRTRRDLEDQEAQDARLGPLNYRVWNEALEEDQLRAQQEIRGLRPTKHIPLKETNTLIRSDLKGAFAGVKFSVRGDSYSGGASTHINYVDGPPLPDAEAVAKSYSGATFDGMTDMKSYVSSADFDADGVPQSVSYGPDFVFVRREFSEETTHDATARAISAFQAAGIEFDPNGRGRFQDNIPQELLRGNEALNRAHWRGYGMTSHEIIRTLAEDIANEKWAAKTGHTQA